MMLNKRGSGILIVIVVIILVIGGGAFFMLRGGDGGGDVGTGGGGDDNQADCTEGVKVCPDGSSVSRNKDNNCQFDPCSEGGDDAPPVDDGDDVPPADDGDDVPPADGDDGGSSSTNFDEEWEVMQNLIAAIEARDETEIDRLFYLSQAWCPEDFPEETCWMIRDGVAAQMKSLKKSDFTRVKKDSKQTVIGSEHNVAIAAMEGDIGMVTVYFAKKDGDYILVISTADIRDGTPEEDLIDSDGDGLIDIEERGILESGEDCGYTGFSFCTDPNNPDSDGDGWWDGIEAAVGLDPSDPDDYLFK